MKQTDDQPTGIETLLLDYTRRLARYPLGRRAIVIHLSRLRPDNRRAHHIRIAANTFEALVKQFDGQIFVLQNGDIIFVCKDASIAVIDEAIMRLRYLFGDDPLAAELDENGPDRFATWYDLERDYQEFLALAEEIYEQEAKRKKRIAAIAGSGQRPERQPMDPQGLAELVNLIQRADLSNVMRRQSICAILRDETPKPVFREIYISIPDLRDSLMPKRDIASDRWLFQHLTQHLDRRVLAMLRRNDDQAIAHSYSLNLNISTLLSQEFHQFDQSLRSGARGSIVIELQNGHLRRSRRLHLRPRLPQGARLPRLPRRRLGGDARLYRSRAARPRPRQDVLVAGHGRSAAHGAHHRLPRCDRAHRPLAHHPGALRQRGGGQLRPVGRAAPVPGPPYRPAAERRRRAIAASLGNAGHGQGQRLRSGAAHPVLRLNFAPGSVSEELALWFAGRGHAVEAVAAAGTRAGESAAWWSSEQRGGIRITRCPRRRAALPGGLGEQAQHLSFALSSAPALLRRARRFRPALVAAIDPAGFALPVALLAARRARAPSWVHVSEERLLAAPLLARASHVSLAAVGADALLAAAGVAEARRLALPSWIDSRAIHPLAVSPLRDGLGLEPDSIVALYAGSLEEHQGVERLVAAAQRLPANGAVVFVLAGRGGSWPMLAAATHGLPLRLLPWPRAANLNALLALADIHVLPAGVATPIRCSRPGWRRCWPAAGRWSPPGRCRRSSPIRCCRARPMPRGSPPPSSRSRPSRRSAAAAAPRRGGRRRTIMTRSASSAGWSGRWAYARRRSWRRRRPSRPCQEPVLPL